MPRTPKRSRTLPSHEVAFRTWEEFSDAVNSPISPAWRKAIGENATPESEKPSNYQWDLGVSFEAALKMLASPDPWPSGLAAIENAAREQATRALRKRMGLSIAWASQGDDFDVGRVLSGENACYTELESDSLGAIPHAVHIIASITTSFMYSSEQIAARWCAIASSVLTLESSNCPVSLWAYNGVKAHKGDFTVTHLIRVKDSGMPLNIQRLVMLSHPAFIRRLAFRLIEQVPFASQAVELKKGYGFPDVPSIEALQVKTGQGSAFANSNDVYYLPSLSATSGPEATAAVLATMLQAQTSIKGTDDYDGEERCESDSD